MGFLAHAGGEFATAPMHPLSKPYLPPSLWPCHCVAGKNFFHWYVSSIGNVSFVSCHISKLYVIISILWGINIFFLFTIVSNRCRTKTGRSCQIPFIYEEMYYDTCINIDNGGVPWCYTNILDMEWDACTNTTCQNLQSGDCWMTSS